MATMHHLYNNVPFMENVFVTLSSPTTTYIPNHIRQKSFNFTRNLSVFANILMVILNQNERHLLDWTFNNDVVRLTLDITIIVRNKKGIALVIIVVQ